VGGIAAAVAVRLLTTKYAAWLEARLKDVGDREGALVATREAVELYRKLASTRPDAFLPDLAGCLDNLDTMLGDVGDREGALGAKRKAV
jgi:hypothetical protein